MKKHYIIIISAILGITACILIYFGFLRKDKPHEESNESKTEYQSLLGTGFNTILGEETGQGIQPAKIIPTSGPDGAKGGKCYGYAELITSYKDFAKKTNLSIDANFKLFGAKVSSSASMFRSFKFNSKSQFLYADLTLINPSKRLERAVFTNEAKRLAEKDIVKFFQDYGDEFAYEQEMGGKLRIIYEFKSSSYIEDEQNAYQISIVKKFFNSGFSVNTQLKEELQKVEKNENMSLYFFREGDYEAIPKLTFDELLTYYRTFPEKVKPGSEKEVVTKVNTKPYRYAQNKPRNIEKLGNIVFETSQYIDLLNDQLSNLYESLGNARYVKENRLSYKSSVVEKVIDQEKTVEKQIQETVSLYDAFKNTGKFPKSIEQIEKRKLVRVSIPESTEEEYLPIIEFGEETLNNKVYFGKISVSSDVFVKVDGSLDFLGTKHADGVMSFAPVYRGSWVQKHLDLVPSGFKYNGPTDIWETPMVKPVHIFLHDFYSKKLIGEYAYENEHSIKIPPGKYEIYLLFDTNAIMVIRNPTHAIGWNNGPNDNILEDQPVVNIAGGSKLKLKFYRNVVVRQ